jgi:chromate reductase
MVAANDKSSVRPIRLVAMAGSMNPISYNRGLVEIAAGAAEACGARVDRIDLAAFALPLYSPVLDAENGFPPLVREFRRAFDDVDGWLLSTPEYNGSVPGALKNAIDWLSRPDAGEEPLALRAFRGKVVGLLSASPGSFGGLRALNHLSYILSGLSMLVLPGHVAVPFAHQALSADGLQDSATHSAVVDLSRRVVHFAAAARQPLQAASRF